ncbi:MAG: hypothetical protein ACR2I0_08150, partial [Rhodoferax sp.]
MPRTEPVVVELHQAARAEAPLQGRRSQMARTAAPVDPLIMFTKLVPPRYPKAMIERASLLSRLRQDDAPALTIFQAPSGFGKTVAMVQWRNALIAAGHTVAWLGLDPNDNDETQFLLCLVASLRKAGCEIGDGVFAAYRRGSVSAVDGFLTALVNELWQARQNIFLLVDDLNRVSDPAALLFLHRLAEHAPDNLRLVVASSGKVNLPAHYARSRIAVIDTRALTFSYAEAESFFNERLGFPLTAEDLRRLYDATEGWIVAMQLATSAIRNSPDPKLFISRISVQSIDVAGYLTEDAMSRLTKEQLEFFVKTSFLEHLHPDLCGYVTGLVDADECLEKFSAQAIFLQPVEGNLHWYRFLPLFAQYLRSKFELLSALERKELLARAAEWLGSREHYAEAVDYALQAGVVDEAIEWVAKGVRQLVKEGKVITSLTLIDRIPSDRIEQNKRLKMAIALVKSYSYQFREAQEIIDALEEEALVAGEIPSLELNFIRARIASFRDDSEACSLALSRFADSSTIRDPALATLLCNANSYVHFSAGRFEEARRAQQMALRWSPQARGIYAVWLGRFIFALSYAAQAEMDRAGTIYREVLVQAEERGGRRSATACMAAAGLAETLYEGGRLGEVLTLLANRMDVVDQTAIPELLIRSNICYARTLMVAGEPAAAMERVRHLQRLGELRDSDRVQAAAFSEAVRLHLSAKDIPNALRAHQQLKALAEKHATAQRGTLSDIRLLEELATTRLLLADQQWQSALALLERPIAECEDSKRWYIWIQLKTLQAICRHRMGQDWLDALKAPWQLAEKNALFYAIADIGPGCLDLIGALRASHSLRLLAVSESFLERVQAAVQSGPVQSIASARSAASAPAKSLLTETEREIVALVARGMANKQIANTLSIG